MTHFKRAPLRLNRGTAPKFKFETTLSIKKKKKEITSDWQKKPVFHRDKTRLTIIEYIYIAYIHTRRTHAVENCCLTMILGDLFYREDSRVFARWDAVSSGSERKDENRRRDGSGTEASRDGKRRRINWKRVPLSHSRAPTRRNPLACALSFETRRADNTETSRIESRRTVFELLLESAEN